MGNILRHLVSSAFFLAVGIFCFTASVTAQNTFTYKFKFKLNIKQSGSPQGVVDATVKCDMYEKWRQSGSLLASGTAQAKSKPTSGNLAGFSKEIIVSVPYQSSIPPQSYRCYVSEVTEKTIVNGKANLSKVTGAKIGTLLETGTSIAERKGDF